MKIMRLGAVLALVAVGGLLIGLRFRSGRGKAGSVGAATADSDAADSGTAEAERGDSDTGAS